MSSLFDEMLEEICEKNQKIADLEAKLAQTKMNESFEKEKKDNAFKFIEELKQQLAEKDKTIENLRIDLKDYQDLEEKISTKYDKVVEKLAQADHDKISFCIEQLKETQIYVDNQHFMNARYKCEKKVYADIWNFIDNQIKQLKEGK